MPSVPTLSSPTTQSTGLPGVRQSASGSESIGIAAGQDVALGQGLLKTGTEVSQIAYTMRQQADAARVDDAVNQATEAALRLTHDKEGGYTSQTGYDALSRKSGMPLADEYSGKLKETINAIGGGLGNEEQRRAFNMRSNDIVTRFYGQAMDYEGKQYREYNGSIKEATVKNASNALALNYTDPFNVASQTTRIRAAIEGGKDENGVFVPGLAQMSGKSAAWAQQKADEAVSDAHVTAINAALQQGNVTGAMRYFDSYSKQMTAADLIKVQGHVNKEFDVKLGDSVGNKVFDAIGAPALKPTDFSRFSTLVIGSGAPVKGSGEAGMKVAATLTPEEQARDEAFERTPANIAELKGEIARQKDPKAKADLEAHLARITSPAGAAPKVVPQATLAGLVKEYNGDLNKATAAFNTSPEAVNEAVTRAKGRAGGDWLTFMPQKTQDIVNQVNREFTEGKGTPAKPTLAQLVETGRAQLGPGATALQVKTMTDTVTRRYELENKAIKQREEETVAEAMRLLSTNGGRYSDLPASVRIGLTTNAPGKIDEVMNFGKRIASGDDTTDMRVYQDLSTDPRMLLKMSDNAFFEFRSKLSEADFKAFAKQRGDLKNGTSSNAPTDLNTQAIGRVLNDRLTSMGLDPTPSDGNKAARVGAIRRFVDAQVTQAQVAAGKKFTDAENAAYINVMFAQSQKLKSFFGNDASMPLLTMTASDIPSDWRDALKANLAKQGNTNPTDSDVLLSYWASKFPQPQKTK